MRLNWFSWAPVETAAFGQDTTVVRWAPRGAPAPHGAHAHLYDPFDVPWREVNRADATVFQIGREPESFGAVWPVLRAHPGVVVLEPDSLHEGFLAFCHACRDREQYLSTMARYHGGSMRTMASLAWAGLYDPAHLAARFPLLELIAYHALGVLAPDSQTERAILGLARIPIRRAGSPDALPALIRLADTARPRLVGLAMAGRAGDTLAGLVGREAAAPLTTRTAAAIASLLPRDAAP